MSTDWPYLREFVRLRDAPAPEPEPESVITVPGHWIEFAELPSAARKVAEWLTLNGWLVRAQYSETRHRPELYAADSKTTGARRGDVKTGERIKGHFSVQARLVNGQVRVASLWAAWVTISGKTAFDGAVHWDRITGGTVPESSFTPVEEWLRILAPTGAPAKRRPRTTDTESKGA